uniref:Uncharacterized protein n=1 Tax=Helianthus annuus TaxID=4232 RepID=A0A251VLK1_HELAN
MYLAFFLKKGRFIRNITQVSCSTGIQYKYNKEKNQTLQPNRKGTAIHKKRCSYIYWVQSEP